jgi:hypothetical protein
MTGKNLLLINQWDSIHMLSQLQNLQAFVTNQLADVVKWAKSTADIALIDIKTPREWGRGRKSRKR